MLAAVAPPIDGIREGGRPLGMQSDVAGTRDGPRPDPNSEELRRAEDDDIEIPDDVTADPNEDDGGGGGVDVIMATCIAVGSAISISGGSLRRPVHAYMRISWCQIC